MAKPGNKGMVRLVKATVYSMQGLREGIINETAVRQEILLALILTVLAFFVGETLVELLLLIGFPWLILAFELLNSAVEALVDRIGPEYNELSGRAKDLGSAAVFVLLCLTALVWAAVLGRNAGWWFTT